MDYLRIFIQMQSDAMQMNANAEGWFVMVCCASNRPQHANYYRN